MGVMFLKYKLTFIFMIFLLSTSFLSTTCKAGRPVSKLVHEIANGGVVHQDALKDKRSDDQMEQDIIHERLLRVNTKDYGRYDPAPSFVKPPFKLIPN